MEKPEAQTDQSPDQTPDRSEARYSLVAMALHWAMALAFFGMLASGLWMTGAIKVPDTQAFAFDVYQWHKASGVTLFALAVLRLVWRLIQKPPALPLSLPAIWQRAAHLGHLGLYGVMFALPVTGWLMVSANIYGLPTLWFGLFDIPHLHALADLPFEEKEAAEALWKEVHELLAYGFIALIVGHIGAALKHHFIDKDVSIGRILP